MNTDNTSLTSAFISGVDGAAMIDALNAGQEVRITVHQQDQLSDWEEGGQMSSFTSWGSGSGLELKPEITAPGGNIWSTVMDSSYVEGAGKYDDYTGSYSLMSGTSMATPHMAGLAALVEQYVKSQHPQQDAAAIARLAEDAGMGTLTPRGTSYVALSEGRIVGFIRIVKAEAIGTSGPIVVDPQARRLGRGTRAHAGRSGTLRRAAVRRTRPRRFLSTRRWDASRWSASASRPTSAKTATPAPISAACRPVPMIYR